MVVAASVIHPRRPDVELLRAGVPIDYDMLRRMRQLGVNALWVHHDAMRDLDKIFDPDLGQGRRAVYEQLRNDFCRMSYKTVSSGDIQTYRQVVINLVCELIGNHKVAGLTDHLIGGDGDLFAHSSSVAYISVLLGIALESYIVQSRSHLAVENARDLTGLGLGAMLHDIGKIGGEPDTCYTHESTLTVAESSDGKLMQTYRDHPIHGFQMLHDSRAPASATQVILTHHQRWDGSGFPDMRKVTHSRHVGAQSGEGIHIFSRIVSAANVLDNLMRSAWGIVRPPVAALRQMLDDRYEGWFDPVVLDTILRHIPPFAIGSHVTLNDGRVGAVVAPNMTQPCRPIIRLLNEQNRLPDGSYPTVDLQNEPHIFITECAGEYVEPYLFQLPEQEPLLKTILRR